MKTLLILGFTLTMLSACATIGGVGQDISAGADTVSGWIK